MANPRPDIDNAKAGMRRAFGIKKPLRELEASLWEGEEVLLITSGNYGGQTAIAALTSRRLVFVASLLGSRKFDQFRLDQITNVEYRSNVMHGELSVYSAGKSVTMKNMPRDDAQRFANEANRMVGAA